MIPVWGVEAPKWGNAELKEFRTDRLYRITFPFQLDYFEQNKLNYQMGFLWGHVG